MICVDLSDILYPISGDMAWRKFMYRMHGSLLYVPVVIAFNTNDIYVDNYRYVWFVSLLQLQQFDENLNNDPILYNLMKFTR